MADKFRGNNVTRIDERGRLKMPAEFKRLIDAEYGPQFYITSMDGKRAQLYPLAVWEQKEKALEALPPSHPARRKFLDVTSYYGQMAEMDNQGRLLLPQLLREGGGLTADVVVLGMQTMLEVVNHEGFRSELEIAPLTDEHLDALAAAGV